jgi:hypothetical protein
MKVKARDLINTVNLIDNLVLNYKCICIGTDQCPCERCKATIDEVKMLRVQLCSAIIRREDRKEERKGKRK